MNANEVNMKEQYAGSILKKTIQPTKTLP